jgi:DNA processing protein
VNATSAPESERLARAALSRVGEPGHLRLTRMVAEFGACQVLASLHQQSAEADLTTDLAERLRGCDPATELEKAAAKGIRFVVPGDDEWPSEIDDLEHCPPLHERGGIPIGLWARGPLRLDEAAEHAVAIVGSRSATTYGAEVAADIGSTLARSSYAVISGAAFGIDQAAHRGALAAKGLTVAVLACGVDRAYPAAHETLLDYIAERGLVVSEAAPGCAPTRIRFLARNRLIAALARGTVVVEAAIRSGALNTASWTGGLGRTVMGVPGPVTSAPSAGVHQLIRSRDAVLVTNGEEVLEAVGPIGTFTLVEPREEPRARDRLSSADQQVLDAVPLRNAAEAHRIARTAGLGAEGVKEALARLLAAELVEHAGGRWRLVTDETPMSP